MLINKKIPYYLKQYLKCYNALEDKGNTPAERETINSRVLIGLLKEFSSGDLRKFIEDILIEADSIDTLFYPSFEEPHEAGFDWLINLPYLDFATTEKVLNVFEDVHEKALLNGYQNSQRVLNGINGITIQNRKGLRISYIEKILISEEFKEVADFHKLDLLFVLNELALAKEVSKGDELRIEKIWNKLCPSYYNFDSSNELENKNYIPAFIEWKSNHLEKNLSTKEEKKIERQIWNLLENIRKLRDNSKVKINTSLRNSIEEALTSLSSTHDRFTEISFDSLYNEYYIEHFFEEPLDIKKSIRDKTR